jgi:hypothetical protein
VISGATGAVAYLWSTGENTSTIAVGVAGEYCLTVTDDAGCQDADCITISIYPVPTFVCPVTNESLPGANDGAIGCDTIPGFIFLWSTGATTAAITGLGPDIYCLTITEIATGCVHDECFTVQPGNCQLIITSIITDNTCNGDATGNVDVNVSNATVPVTFQWSNGDTDASLNNVSAGTYTVTISDAAGCVEVREYTVSQPDPLIITVDSIMMVSDFPDGAVFITVTGGTSPYAYDWSNEAGDTSSQEDFVNIWPGYAAVEVTDANGCVTALDSILVEEIIATMDVRYNPLKVYPVPVDNMLIVDLERNIEEVILTAIDGRTVMQTKNIHANRIDVSRIDAGWYLLRVFDGEQWYIARIIK